MGHLAQGVHPGVGAPRAVQLGDLAEDLAAGLFDSIGDGVRIFLGLPATITGAVVLKVEAVGRHC